MNVRLQIEVYSRTKFVKILSDLRPYWYEAWWELCSVVQLPRYDSKSSLTDRPPMSKSPESNAWMVRILCPAVGLVDLKVDDTCVGSF